MTLAPRPGDQYGTAVFEKVMGMARDLVLELKGHEVRDDEDIICINDRGGDAFLVFLPPALASSAAAAS